MDCKKANELMMNYFDSPLNNSICKTHKLHKHLQKCDSCREEFTVYDEIMTDLQLIDEPIEPPADMEASVMTKILLIESVEKENHTAKENIPFVLCGVVSVLIGLYFVFGLNGDAIQAIATQFSRLVSGITQYQYLFILPAIGLVLIQPRFEVYRKTRKNDD